MADGRDDGLWRSPEERLGGGEDRVRAIGGYDRREFLKLMGASLALAGAAACHRDPIEPIVPYVRMPEGVVPGRPLFYATALTRGGFARGVLVESHTGRPTKVEGNPDHPASLGATDIFDQASVLALYDPDRSRAPYARGRVASFDAFTAELSGRLRTKERRDGRGLALLTGTVTSPTLLGQIRALLGQMPAARWYVHEPVGDEHAHRGAAIAFGAPVDLVHHFDAARVVVSLDSDHLFDSPGCVRYAHDTAVLRRRWSPGGTTPPISRLYAAEPTPTITGTRADHRLRIGARRLPALAAALARAVGVDVGVASLSDDERAWVDAAAHDLRASMGRSVVISGRTAPPSVHALAHAMNAALSNLGATVVAIDPVSPTIGSSPATFADLAASISSGEVGTLVILDRNPVYDAPADLDFPGLLDRVDLAVHLGAYRDETGRRCAWHLPLAHPLESWGDARAFDGTVSVIQPLIAPLYGGKTPHDVLSVLAGDTLTTTYERVRAHWREAGQGGGFGPWWQEVLRRGLVPGSAAPPRSVTVDRGEVGAALEEAPDDGVELVFRPDPTIWDGRYGNIGWLQELPKPMSKLTWDNPALLSPALAERLGVESGHVVEIVAGDRTLLAPAFIQPGQADETVTLTLGYGTNLGRVSEGAGVDCYRLRTTPSPWHITGATVRPTPLRVPLATTQDHQRMEGRDLLRSVRVGAAEERERGVPSIYPAVPYEGHQWGMVVDLASCIGCGVCTIACQAENNIPVVGKEQVRAGREMHWIRVDRYFTGPTAAPTRILHQPVPCMQCENAPCEVVCPTGATQHSHDGLNDMTYNRCIGTRYCSNNCPYKVRRFNFLQFADQETESLALGRNPDVSVRARGVMEKCTYCVQRIRGAEIDARREGRPLRDGDIVTACQQACPTGAIVFGDVHDDATRVSPELLTSWRSSSNVRQPGARPEADSWSAGVYGGRTENTNDFQMSRRARRNSLQHYRVRRQRRRGRN